MNPLLKDVLQLNKVGPKSRDALNQVGIYRVCDLLHYYPRSYETVEQIQDIASLVVEENVYVKGRIASSVDALRFSGKIMVQCILSDDSGKIKLVFFNQPYIKKILHQGDEVIIKGKFVIKNNRKMITNPKIIKPDEYEKLQHIQLKPIYPLTRSLKLSQLTNYVEQSLEIMKYEIDDYISNDIRAELNLPTLSFAYEKIHYPMNKTNLEIARRRLAFDEFFLFQMAMKSIKEQVQKSENAFVMKPQIGVKHFVKSLPFKLTNAQQKAIDQVFVDFSSRYTMTRLVQGDVGSGKTIIATIALLHVILNGYQGAFMAPTEVLAKQHYHGLSQQLKPYGVRVEILIGSTSAKEKQRIYEQLRLGDIDLIIGTHALIQDKVSFSNLALVITDEQHRFGVMQREALVNKGRYPHTLVMSATPIPRTLALIVYGDLDISVVDELPAGRKSIETYLVNSSYHERLYEFIEKEVTAGHNVYVVCPMVEDGEEESSLLSVESHYETLRENLSSSIVIDKLHGRMKAQEKADAIERFLTFDTQVLVSTTVIEVGVNVPNASLMIIENADRFGLAQLHQLRGRVGRSDIQSYCVLVSDTKSTETKKKLKFLKDHEDGFALAEYDLKMRGPGDAFGTHQHGMPFFKLADLYDDMELLEAASQLSQTYIKDVALEKQLDMFYYQLNTDIGL